MVLQRGDSRNHLNHALPFHPIDNFPCARQQVQMNAIGCYPLAKWTRNRRGASSPRKILSALRSLLVTSETTFTNFAFSAAEDPAVKLFKVHLVARQMGPYHWSGCLKSNTRSPRTMHACIVMSHTTIPSYGCFRLELWWNLSSADLLVWLQMYILFLSCKKKCRQKDCKTRSSSR